MRKLLLDTNMLVVFVIGSIDPNLLGRSKRVKEYVAEDHMRLTGMPVGSRQ